MNCPECDELLQRLLDAETPASPALVEGHLAECTRCRELHQAARLLEAGLASWRLPMPSVQLSDRIVARVLADRRQQLLRRWSYVAAAAAVLLLALPALGWWLFLTQNTPQTSLPSVPIVKQEPKQEDVLPGPSLRSKVEEATTAMASLTDRLAGETRDKAEKFLMAARPPVELGPMGTLPGMSEPDGSLDAAADSLKEAGVGVSTSIETVASSASRAVSFFVREMPSFKKSKAIH